MFISKNYFLWHDRRMLSPEHVRNNQEQWWSYDTPYDIVRRAELVRSNDTKKVQDIDAYIAYINEEMSDSYMVATRFDERTKKKLKEQKSKGTCVYARNKRGFYEPQGHVSMVATFYGDKVLLDGDNPVVINTDVGLGITPSSHVKFSSKYPSGLQYGVENRFRENAFASVVMRLMELDKGDQKYVQEWDSLWG